MDPMRIRVQRLNNFSLSSMRGHKLGFQGHRVRKAK